MVALTRPKDWNELNELLWQHSKDHYSKKHRPYVAFRGLSERHPLKTSVQRLIDRRTGKEVEEKELKWRERRLIDSFKMYAREHLSKDVTDWDVITLGQHYNLPTRLLDWTSSPFVALFFATENIAKWGKDGVVWCVCRHDTDQLLPAKLKELQKEQNTTIFSLDTLNKSYANLSCFDELGEALIWLEPPSINPRIVNQYAFFSVMTGVESSQDEYIKKHKDIAWRIIIPSRLKPEIHDRLQVMNMTHRIIYPGLEGISKWLRAYYGG